jgi:hypothetical protein
VSKTKIMVRTTQPLMLQIQPLISQRGKALEQAGGAI